jgi:hypothetical protein
MEVLINHIGYDAGFAKKSLLKGRSGFGEPERDLGFRIIESKTRKPVFRGTARFLGSAPRWKDWLFWSLDFSALQQCGVFWIELDSASHLGRSPVRSALFQVSQDLLLDRTASAVIGYFRSQRCAGIWNEADRNVGFVGSRSDRVDVHGGWYDASGDVSKYLSHLSYAHYMNPQQTPMVVWNFLRAADLLSRKAASSPPSRAAVLRRLQNELLEEVLYGADFLVRMQDPAGYFYVTVFDRWSKDPDQREICSFRTQAGQKFDDYQAGYRQGGGMAIAALAGISSRSVAQEFGPEEYLGAALTGFDHLEEHNEEYLDNGTENIIDDYCALLAASELYNSARLYGIAEPERFLRAARRRASRLMIRSSSDEHFRGWWRADEHGERPYYHAAEAGLPVVSLLRYGEVEPDESRRQRALAAVRSSLLFELTITAEVSNPFGYARQYVRPVGGPKRSAFFIPHANESGYWWQGENARLASLAAAARMSASALPNEPDLQPRLEAYAADQLNWILGLNPFDTCMLHGFGRNNPEYEPEMPNAFGGICNGITAGFEDEEDVDFLPLPYAGQREHRWRWSEQWIPHAAWYLLALCAA